VGLTTTTLRHITPFTMPGEGDGDASGDGDADTPMRAAHDEMVLRVALALGSIFGSAE